MPLDTIARCDISPDIPAASPALRSGGDGSRVASPDAWNKAAVMIAGGAPLKAVAAHLGCSRTTLWRVVQRSERFRTRVAEERRFLTVEAAARFRGLHGAAVDAIAAAVGRGDLRAAFWVADRLGLAEIDLGEASAGLALADDLAAWDEGPPVDPALYALDAPLVLEPDVAADLSGAAAPSDHAAASAQAKPHPEASRPEPKRPEARRPEARRPEATGTPRETFPETCFRTFHEQAAPKTDRSGLDPDILRCLPRTAAAWPSPPPNTVTMPRLSKAPHHAAAG